MASATSTIKLKDTIEWAKKMNYGRNSVIGNSLEPALTSANMVRQTMLGAPFSWYWNSQPFTFTCNPTQTPDPQNYTVNIPNFAWVEHSNVKDPTTGKQFEMENKQVLALDSNPARPRYIDVYTYATASNPDADPPIVAGDITFRVMPPPDKAYVATIYCVTAPPLFTGIEDTWGIPDNYSYIYNWGFLAMMWMFADDNRFPVANQKFVASLLAANRGLSDIDRNIFLNNWSALTQTDAMKDGQSVQARGM
jgi:hypothetical protein